MAETITIKQKCTAFIINLDCCLDQQEAFNSVSQKGIISGHSDIQILVEMLNTYGR
jgi:hypothetical protein